MGLPAAGAEPTQMDHITKHLRTQEVAERISRTDDIQQLGEYFYRLEAFLAEFGEYLRHTSGGRGVDRNAHVGGHPDSRHLWKHGDADDWVLKARTRGSMTYLRLSRGAIRHGLTGIVHNVGSGTHLHTQIPKWEREREEK